MERKKTFCPVFWSARRQISATISGAIPSNHLSTQDSSVTATNSKVVATEDQAVHNEAATHEGMKSNGQVSACRSVSRPGPGIGNDTAVLSWYEPVSCCEGVDDIDEFSSSGEEDDSSRQKSHRVAHPAVQSAKGVCLLCLKRLFIRVNVWCVR